MRIIYSPGFVRAYKKLPLDIQTKAEKAEALFRADPFDARLKTHKLSGRFSRFWSFSISARCRIVFAFAKNDVAHFDLIGGHEVYK